MACLSRWVIVCAAARSAAALQSTELDPLDMRHDRLNIAASAMKSALAHTHTDSDFISKHIIITVPSVNPSS